MTSHQVNDNLLWICEKCGQRLVADDGVLYMEYGDLHRRDEALEAWTKANPESERGGAAYMSFPSAVHWHVRHNACGGDSEATNAYVIESGRIDTWRKVAAWSAHLMEKSWLADTDWSARIHSAGAGEA